MRPRAARFIVREAGDAATAQHECCGSRRYSRIISWLLLGAALGLTRPLAAQLNVVTRMDSPCDAVVRRTDPGANAPFDSGRHRLPELRETRMGQWAPQNPRVDLFIGEYANTGEFLRLDVVIAGLVNPPGPTRPQAFDPCLYGDHPVYGFIEIDLDDDNQTGGELDEPQFRYLGNVARFGGLPPDLVFAERVATDRAAFDDNFETPPWVERHGEEFHLAMLGDLFMPEDIDMVSGDDDLHFVAGEVWRIRAPWFHRAHGFERYSVAKGGEAPGEYMPLCDVQFRHEPSMEATWISLVFPLTNQGAARMRGEPVQPLNHDPSDQASVHEALNDLVISAQIVDMFGTGEPEEAIILGWKDKDPAAHLRPTLWRPTAILGSSYTEPDPLGLFFLWTDVFPDVLRGDVNGDGTASLHDVQAIDGFIADNDGTDGQIDGRVRLVDFAVNFSLFDVNHNGEVNPVDLVLVRPLGDGDDGRDVDLADFALFQACFPVAGDQFPENPCAVTDLDGDGEIDLRDYEKFHCLFTGPRAP